MSFPVIKITPVSKVPSCWNSDSDDSDNGNASKKRRVAGAASILAAAPQLPPAQPLGQSPYQRAAKEIGETQCPPGSEPFKVITIRGTVHRVNWGTLGQGDSFLCYKVTDQNTVIKLFRSLQDSTHDRRKLSAAGWLADFDQRMEYLGNQYKLTRAAGVPCTTIENVESLKTDGCIVQQYVEPVQVSWQGRNKLSDHETRIITLFCETFKQAQRTPNIDWDLKPSNFGFDGEQLKLFDFCDKRLSSERQRFLFLEALTHWEGNNPAAKELIATMLAEK